MTLLPQQNDQLIQPQQTIIVKVTISLFTTTTEVVTIHVVIIEISRQNSGLLYVNKTFG